MSIQAALLLVISIAVSTTAAVTAADAPTVYQVLEDYGFPTGLLPQGVTSYELNADTGKFSVKLNKTCKFSVSGYDLKYAAKITGTISSRKVSNLDGIQVKILFFWVNIIEVTIDGDDLEFSVGIASADFPANNFSESPQCGCGFDCRKSEGFGFGIRRIFPRLLEVY